MTDILVQNISFFLSIMQTHLYVMGIVHMMVYMGMLINWLSCNVHIT